MDMVLEEETGMGWGTVKRENLHPGSGPQRPDRVCEAQSHTPGAWGLAGIL